MKFIDRDDEGAFWLDRYEAYVAAERTRLAPRLSGADLLAPDRNGLAGRRTLHDAWLEALVVRLPIDPSRPATVRLRLLGAYHDRVFVLRYEGVSAQALEVPGPRDDLLVHELRLEGVGLVHELLFASGRTLLLTCTALHFEEQRRGR